eukprot:PhF_6_TR9121/c0_g1_i1/m.14190
MSSSQQPQLTQQQLAQQQPQSQLNNIRHVVILIKIAKLKVTLPSDDIDSAVYKYGVQIKHDKRVVLQPHYADSVVHRDPSTDVVQNVVSWEKANQTSIHVSMTPDGKLINPVVVTLTAIQYHVTQQTFYDFGVKHISFVKYTSSSLKGTINLNPNAVIELQVTMNYYRETDSPKSCHSISSLADHYYIAPSPVPSPRTTPVNMLNPRASVRSSTTMSNSGSHYDPRGTPTHRNSLTSSSSFAPPTQQAPYTKESIEKVAESLRMENAELRAELEKERKSYDEMRHGIRQVAQKYEELLQNHEGGGRNSRCVCVIL